MIALDQVSKTYARLGVEHRVLDSVSALLRAGRNFGVLGRKHAGKSTLLRLISGVEFPDRGRIRRGVRISWPLGHGKGLEGKLSGRDNIRFVARLHGVDWRSLVRQVDDFAELGGLLDQRVSNYDGPMKNRLLAGLWFALDFDCRVVDSHGGMGGAHFARKFDAYLEERRKSCWMIEAASVPKALRRHCESGAVLHEGKLTVYDDFRAAIGSFRRLEGAAA
jgi:capsular polysaccharide transport system ATP-binding protein